MKNYFWLSLFLLFVSSCTETPVLQGAENFPILQVQIEQLNELLEAKKGQEAIKTARQKTDEWLNAKETKTDIQVEQANQLVDILVRGYAETLQFQAGAEYLDSLADSPFMEKNCHHELYAGRAYLRQLMGDNKRAIWYADMYQELPDCDNAERFIANSEKVGNVYIYCGNDIPKAVRILEKAVDVYRAGGEYLYMMRIISRLGIYYRLIGEFEKAAAANQEAISSYNDSMPPQNVMIAYGEQAILYCELGLYEQALQQNSMAMHYSLLKDSFGVGDIYRGRTEIFMNMQKKDSALHYLKKSEQASEAIGSFKGVIVSKIMRVRAYLDYPDSLQSAIKLGTSLYPDTVRIPKWATHQLQLYLGQALWKSGQQESAIPILQKASQGFARMDMIKMEYTTNKILLDYFQRHKMTNELTYYYNRNRLFDDSLKADEKLRAIVAANISFDVNRKLQENDLLAARIQRQQQEILYYFLISIVLLLILVGSIIYTQRKRRTDYLLMQQSKQKIKHLKQHQQSLSSRNEQLTEQVEQLTANNTLTSTGHLTCQSLLNKEDEIAFRQSFAVVHPSYLPKLRTVYPRLTRNEELLAMLICMGHSTDEIALVMGINRSSVNVMRSRMRKNMNLSREESLDETIRQYLS